MNKLSSIGIIIPYFGEWPEWINYFLLSCKYNPTIDWHFFTDCGLVEIKAENLIFHPMSLDEFNELASKKLHMKVSVKHPYKLCDYKPAYGIIFEDYIKKYDFWGYGDIDLVYGDIRKFFSSEKLEEYDILSNHNEFVAGHFCLLRNSEKIKHLFMQGKFYQDAFKNNKYIGFDEQILTLKVNLVPRYFKFSYNVNLFYQLLLYKISRSFLKKIFVPYWRFLKKEKYIRLFDFTSIVKRALFEKEIKVDFSMTFQSDLVFKKKRILDWMIKWDKGSLIDALSGKELLYFHFILSKTSKNFKIDSFKSSLRSFTIQKTGIKIYPRLRIRKLRIS